MRQLTLLFLCSLILCAPNSMATPFVINNFWGDRLRFSFVVHGQSTQFIEEFKVIFREQDSGTSGDMKEECKLPCNVGHNDVHEIIHFKQTDGYLYLWTEFYRYDDLAPKAPHISYPVIVLVHDGLNREKILQAYKVSEFRYLRRY